MSLDLDEFISRHLNPVEIKKNKRLKYTADELHELAKMSIDTFRSEPSLVRMNPPCIIVGDIHGQFMDLLRMFSSYTKDKAYGALSNRFVFLGDYVDRGPNSIECLGLILALKIRWPTKFQVLRGNHECENINILYGFRKELLDRLGQEEGQKLFVKYNEVFSWMPLAGLVGKRILCMHGGISPDLKSFEDIEKIERPLADVSKVPLALDLLWSDPMENLDGFMPNETREVSKVFGEDEVHRVCNDLKIQLIVRGHQMMMSGYGEFANRRLVTIFTAPRYQVEKPNAGATMTVDAKGRIGITVLVPVEYVEEDEDENAGGSTDTINSKYGSASAGKSSEGATTTTSSEEVARKKKSQNGPRKKASKK